MSPIVPTIPVLYSGNAHYSYISWETIYENIRAGWEWDRSLY
jgi:hypothetical protein